MKDEQKIIIENYISAYNNFDVDGMTKNLHSEIVFKNISNGNIDLTTLGIEEFKKQAESAKEYFKERKQMITSWNFDDSVVSVDIDYIGVLAIELPNGMKTGDTLQLKGQSIFVFTDSKIIEITDKS